MDIDEAAFRNEAYEALRKLMWTTDLLFDTRPEVQGYLTILSNYLSR